MRTYKRNLKYWRDMHIDWKKSYWDTNNIKETLYHPHRNFLMAVLKTMKFNSLVEIGCASGPNLYRVSKEFPNVEFGGVDINKDAIEVAKELLPRASVLEVQNATSLFLSDKSVDVVLTDACLMYLNRRGLNKSLKEIKRVARNGIVLCELHCTNPIHRFRLKHFDRIPNIRSFNLFKYIKCFWEIGYSSHNFIKLLTKHGFRSIQVYKIPKEAWSGFPWEVFGYVITAKL